MPLQYGRAVSWMFGAGCGRQQTDKIFSCSRTPSRTDSQLLFFSRKKVGFGSLSISQLGSSVPLPWGFMVAAFLILTPFCSFLPGLGFPNLRLLLSAPRAGHAAQPACNPSIHLKYLEDRTRSVILQCAQGLSFEGGRAE